MVSFWLIQGILLVIILILLYFLSWFWPPDSPWAPWWSTNEATARIMCKLVKMKKKDIMYDLGSGEGTALILAAKEFGIRGVGIELDPWRAWYSRQLVRFAGLTNRIKIVRGTFFPYDISEATVVFAYLVPKTLIRLKKKFLAELAPGTRIVCYRYQISYLPMIVEDKERKIYIYEIPKKLKGKQRIK